MHRSGVAPEVTRINPAQDGGEQRHGAVDTTVHTIASYVDWISFVIMHISPHS
jgi:hypothetical protein